MTFKGDIQLWVRLGAAAFVTLAVTAAAIDARRDGREQTRPALATADSNHPLAAELSRCGAITDPALVDDACRQAWAERRARFFSSSGQEPKS